jgi:glycosyltransferase involved in cell wall biosynthesis
VGDLSEIAPVSQSDQPHLNISSANSGSSCEFWSIIGRQALVSVQYPTELRQLSVFADIRPASEKNNLKRIALIPCIHRAKIWPTLIERVIPELVEPLVGKFEVHVILLNAVNEADETILKNMQGVVVSHLNVVFRNYDHIAEKLIEYVYANDISIITNVMGGGLYVGWILNQVKQRTGAKSALRVAGDEIRARSLINVNSYLGSPLSHSHAMISQANMQACDSIIVMCEDEADRIRTEHGNDDKIHVLPRGVHLADFPFNVKEQKKTELHVSYVGRPSSEKGFDVFCNVAHQLSGEPFRFSFAGIAPDCTLPSNVTYKGYLDQKGVIEHMQDCDILLLPSKTDALPQSLLEAAASGCVGLVPRTLLRRDFASGVIRSTIESGAIVQNLRSASQNKTLLQEKAREARGIVETKFDKRVCSSRMLNFFEDLSLAS